MVVRIKKTYSATKVFIFGVVFYFLFMARLSQVKAATDTDCSTPLNVENETYNLTGDTSVSCVIANDGIILDGHGYTINGIVNGSGNMSHVDGFNFTVKNTYVAGYGGVTANGYNGFGYIGNGGNIIITDHTTLYGSITTTGVSALASAGSNGGNVSVTDFSSVNGFINVWGGSSNNNIGGNGGDVIITNSSVNGFISCTGGYSNAILFGGGSGGDITIQNSTAHILYSSGGNSYYGTSNGGSGGTITIAGSTVTDIFSSAGSSYYGTGGTGGIINIQNSIAGNILTVGGTSEHGTGGASGKITITDHSTVHDINSSGNESSWGSIGGIGGAINITDSNINSITSTGGFSYGYGVGGAGGAGGEININGSTVTTNIFSTGGNSNHGTGGAGGIITVQNSTGRAVVSFGGNTFADGNAGIGGQIIIEHSNLSFGASSQGGDAIDGLGGNGGAVGIENSTSLGVASIAGHGYGYVYGNGGDVNITNSDVTVVNTYGSTVGNLTIIDDAPVVTLNGSQNINLNVGDVYTELGATASDTKYTVTPLTATPTGTVDTNTPGQYDITYTSDPDGGTHPSWNGVPQTSGLPTDHGVLSQTGTKTRTVNVLKPSSGINGGYLAGYGPMAKIIPTVNTSTGSFLVISEIQKVTKDLKLGMKNKDVKILQSFLINQNKGPFALALKKHGATNNFGALTKLALEEWQKTNSVIPSTGYFGTKTRAKIKLLNL